MVTVIYLNITIAFVMLDWNKINTVLLDMDGTLLDLNFDNHFSLEFVPGKNSACIYIFHGLN